MGFKKATKEKLLLRVCLCGPSGSGKTYTALAIATGLGLPIRCIDSEHGSARKYSDRFSFDVLELENDQSPAEYVAAIEEAYHDGFRGTLIIDSLSHAWMGKGGALEQVDRIASGSKSGNSFTAWREVTPQHNKLVDAILRCPLHVIVTLRVKTEYILEDTGKGTKAPRKIGMQPVMRDGVEYEFDVVGDLDLNNQLEIGKTRCSPLKGQTYLRPGANVARILLEWANDGTDARAAAPAPAKGERPSAEANELQGLTATEAAAWPALRRRFLECEANQVTLGPLQALAKDCRIQTPSKAWGVLCSAYGKRARAAIEARIKAAQSKSEEEARSANAEWGFGGAAPEPGRVPDPDPNNGEESEALGGDPAAEGDVEPPVDPPAWMTAPVDPKETPAARAAKAEVARATAQAERKAASKKGASPT
jgi:hypothetical protein